MTTLDWSGSAHWSNRRTPCVHCGADTNLRTAAGQPAHKVCVERILNQRKHLRVVKEAS